MSASYAGPPSAEGEYLARFARAWQALTPEERANRLGEEHVPHSHGKWGPHDDDTWPSRARGAFARGDVGTLRRLAGVQVLRSQDLDLAKTLAMRGVLAPHVCGYHSLGGCGGPVRRDDMCRGDGPFCETVLDALRRERPELVFGYDK